MDLKRICTEDDHQAALRRASTFFENEPELRTPDGNCFEILILLIQDDENRHYPVELPDPLEVIQFRMEQSGLTPKD
jgi:HTH-type transcriptional regulator/antitoxin HigA